MTRCDRGRTSWLLAATTLLAGAVACTDRAGPTAPPDTRADVLAAAQPNKPKGPTPKIKSLSLGTTTLAIGGASFTYTPTIQNANTVWTGIWVKAEVVQGSNSATVGGTYILCPNTAIGTLPAGGCTFSASAAVPASTSLVPGSATFVLTLYQVVNDVLTQLDAKSLPVTLVAGPPSITSLSVSPATLVIDGASGTWSATMQNPGSPLSGILAQGYVVQGTDTVPTGGATLQCPSAADGTLPTGSCSTSGSVGVSSSAIGGSQLVAGSADFLLVLFQTSNNVTTVVATKTYPVTLASGTPTITSVVFDPSVPRRSDDSTVILLIDPNTSNGYTVTVNNPGLQQTGIGIQAEIHQGTAVRGAGGSDIICENLDPVPAGGTLPTGTCVMQFNTTATNTAGGSGDLTEGYADWVLYLQDANGNIASITIRVYLALQQT